MPNQSDQPSSSPRRLTVSEMARLQTDRWADRPWRGALYDHEDDYEDAPWDDIPREEPVVRIVLRPDLQIRLTGGAARG